MNEVPNYGSYTSEELAEARLSIDRGLYPDNFQALEKEIAGRRKKSLADLYNAARWQYEGEGDHKKAGALFRRVIEEFPDTLEAQYAAEFLGEISGNEHLQSRQELKLVFSGSAKEYFRIWIVNLCLTLVTFGIFSAWAKVRKKRYFYSHLTLDGTPFQYLGLPVPILKGRIIAAALFLTYYLSSNVFTAMFPYVLAVGLVLAPWIVVQSASFKARYSAYRNITFHFGGTYVAALKVISAWGVLPVIVTGTMFNWWGRYWAAGVAFGVFGLLFPWWFRNVKNFIVTNTSYGGQRGHFGATGGQFWGIYFVSGLILAGFGVVTGILTASGVVFEVPYGIYLALLPAYGGYIMAFAYVQAKTTNIVWNNMGMGPVSFLCTLKTPEMAKLYFTNAIAIVASAGMLIPWAVVRTYRYRVDHTRLFHDAELTAFQGSRAETVQAAGAELSEIFDMDLSI
jgi:uncharacterized membrane protein YjgN (DUF898 family)